MKKKKIVVDRIYMENLNYYSSLIEIITYCAQLYTKGYNKLEYHFDDLFVCKEREETDEEFNKRIQAEKKIKEKLKLKKKNNEEKTKKKRLELYEKLKKEFENET